MNLTDKLLDWLSRQRALGASVHLFTLGPDWHVELYYQSGARVRAHHPEARQAILEARLQRDNQRHTAEPEHRGSRA